ncbi:MAG: hypothetical protein QW128_04040 [Thermoprotei archaeon]
MKIGESEFYWCSVCRTDVFINDVDQHKNHNIHLGAYDDPESHIETYSAD